MLLLIDGLFVIRGGRGFPGNATSILFHVESRGAHKAFALLGWIANVAALFYRLNGTFLTLAISQVIARVAHIAHWLTQKGILAVLIIDLLQKVVRQALGSLQIQHRFGKTLQTLLVFVVLNARLDFRGELIAVAVFI